MMISVRNLTKRFGDFPAVQDVTFNVKKGEIFAFLGPNGAGKSTTIKMLTTLLSPTSGAVEIDGLDPAKHPNQVRKQIGIVFQDPSLDTELTAYENIEFHGVLYHVPKRVRGERILCLLHDTKIIFLDEPTLGLDPQTRHQLWSQVRVLNQDEQVTVFLTTHYMEEAERVADRIAIIDHGRIIAEGTAAELKSATSSESLEQAFLSLTGS